MKKLFSLLLAVAFIGAAQAQSNAEAVATNKKITVKDPITTLIINDGISVILMDDETDEIIVEGKSTAVQNVQITLVGSRLIVSSSAKSPGKQAAVYVSSQYLKRIEINGESLVGSYQALRNQSLDVLVNGDCELKIKSYGKVNVSTTNDYAVTYASKPTE